MPERAVLDKRTVAILFADTRGFSGLSEYELRGYATEVLPRLANVLEETEARFVNSWGDGIVAVFNMPPMPPSVV